IHFETLLFNPDIPNEYKQLQGLLKQGVGDITKTQSLFLFHYYGHYSEVTNFELNQDKTNSIPRWLRGFSFHAGQSRGRMEVIIHSPYDFNKNELDVFFSAET
ncbi:MAG: hypothetical protein PHV30_12045, partial [Candidatus Margulisbacteria bacterium]|nr:hypothetical protein [Candidatus Margulisiibacteriota bacterium]